MIAIIHNATAATIARPIAINGAAATNLAAMTESNPARNEAAETNNAAPAAKYGIANANLDAITL